MWNWQHEYLDARRALINRRAARKVTQAHAAARMGISVRQFQRFESGENTPDAAQLFAWAACLGLRVKVFEHQVAEAVEVAST